MNELTKPASIVYEEFRQELVNMVNNSGLPAFIIELVLRDLYEAVKDAANNQYKSDKAMFEEQLANQFANSKESSQGDGS